MARRTPDDDVGFAFFDAQLLHQFLALDGRQVDARGAGSGKIMLESVERLAVGVRSSQRGPAESRRSDAFSASRQFQSFGHAAAATEQIHCDGLFFLAHRAIFTFPNMERKALANVNNGPCSMSLVKEKHQVRMTLNFASLSKAVSGATEFVGALADDASFTFMPGDDCVEASTGDDRRRISVPVDGEASGFGEGEGLSVNAKSLKKLAGMRTKPKELSVRVRKGVAEFSAKTKAERVLGYLNVMPTEDFRIEIPSDKNKDYVKLSADGGMAMRMRDAFALVDLEPVAKLDSMNIWFRLDEESFTMMARDKWHMAHVEDRRFQARKGRSVQVAMDNQLFGKMLSTMGSGPCSFHVSDREVIAHGGKTKAQAKSLQPTSEIDIFGKAAQVRGNAMAVGKKDRDMVLADKADIESMLANLDMSPDSMEAVFSAGEDGFLEIGSKVDKGKSGHVSTRSSIEVDWKEGTRYVAWGPMVKDLLGCMGESQVMLSFYKDQLWSILRDKKKDTTICYMMLLQQDGDE